MAMARANSEGKLCFSMLRAKPPATRPFIVMARQLVVQERFVSRGAWFS